MSSSIANRVSQRGAGVGFLLYGVVSLDIKQRQKTHRGRGVVDLEIVLKTASNLVCLIVVLFEINPLYFRISSLTIAWIQHVLVKHGYLRPNGYDFKYFPRVSKQGVGLVSSTGTFCTLISTLQINSTASYQCQEQSAMALPNQISSSSTDQQDSSPTPRSLITFSHSLMRVLV